MGATTSADTHDRWINALHRAKADRVQVKESNLGNWFAKSGAHDARAYWLDVRGNVVLGCECPAGQKGDPVCKHRAAFYAMIGALPTGEDVLLAEVTAPDTSPDFAPAPESCDSCTGGRIEEWVAGHVSGCQPCPVCEGTGVQKPEFSYPV